MAEGRRVPRPIKWIGIVLLVLLALLLILLFVLPKTGPGQGLIDGIARPIIEEQVEAQLGSDIEFDRIAGALPGELVLRDVTLSDNGEPWLTVQRIRLDWSPLALVRGDIVVNSLVITDADLRRRPPPRPEQPEKPEEESGPLNLPSITVERFLVDPLTIREPVIGQAYALTVQARLQAAGQDVDAEADIATASGSDRIRAEILYNPEALTADVSIEGAEDGLVSTLAQADGPVTVRLDGDGPLDAWQGRLAAALGAYGETDATLSGDLAGLTNARFAGALRPGPGLPAVANQVAGETLEIDVATARDGDAVDIQLQQLTGRFGALSGTARLGSMQAETVTVDLSGQVSEVVAEEFGAPFVAGPIRLQADAAQADGGWTVDGSLSTSAFSATVSEGRTNAEQTFAGQVAIRSDGLTIGQERLDPILADGAVASATIDYPAVGPLRVSDIDARLGAGQRLVRAGGQATYDLESQVFDARLTAKAEPAALEQLLGTGTYEGAFDLTVAASGTPQDASVDLEAAIPAGAIDGVAFTAGQLTADLQGLPAAPAGEARVTSEGGDYSGQVVARREGAVIEVPTLTFASGGINLDGRASANPETGAVSANLTLDAGQSTTLITGQTVGGTAEIRAEIGENDGPVDIAIEADELSFEGNTVGTAQITAKGPTNAIAFDVQATEIAAANRFIPFLRTSGTADVATPDRVIDLSTFATALSDDAEESRITLLAPTRIQLGKVIEVSETRIDWLADGQIVAQGRYAPDLWIAELKADELTLPGQPFAADVELSVDSREDRIATFAARARTTNEDLPRQYGIVADGDWTGDRLSFQANLAPEDAAPFGEAKVNFPLVLTRTDGALGVELPEDGLDGHITYASDIAPLYAFAAMDGGPLSGRLDADVRLAGAVTAPEARGEARLTDGAFEEEQFGFALRQIGVEAAFEYTGEETIVRVTGQATDAEGDDDAVQLSGNVRLGAEESAVDVRVMMDNAQLADSAALEFQADADLSLTGPLTDLMFAGTMNIDEMDAAIPNLDGGNQGPEYVPVQVVRVDGPAQDRVGELAEPAPPPFKMGLDLAIQANNAVFVRGRGLDSEWRIDMTVGGTTIEPIIGGEIAILEGTFDFAGREFDLTEGYINFQRTKEINPRLNMQAEYEAEDVTAIVRVTGPAQSPEIELDSNPPRPQEDIMALILFGKPASDLTALESLQIANAVAKLTGKSPLGGGGPGVTDKLRSSLGLDALSLGVGADGQATVGVGKYITDELYVSARQSASEVGTEVIVTYELTDDVTVESILKPDGAQGVSANYKKDY